MSKQGNFISTFFIIGVVSLCMVSYHFSRLGLDAIHESKLVTHGSSEK